MPSQPGLTVAHGGGRGVLAPVLHNLWLPEQDLANVASPGAPLPRPCVGITQLLSRASPLRPPVFQRDRLVSTPAVAQLVDDVLLSSWDLLSHFYTSQEHLPCSNNLFASSGNPQVDHINILLFVRGILLLKVFNRLSGYLLNQSVGISFAIYLWLCLANSFFYSFPVNVGEDCPVFDGLFEFCQLSAGGSVGKLTRHVFFSFSLQQMYVMLFCLGNKLL